MEQNEPLVSVKNLTIGFTVEDRYIEAVDNISFDIAAGESLGLVGESGCGKSVTAMSLLRLLPLPVSRVSSGSMRFDGRNATTLAASEIESIRGKEIGVIFQEPMTSLNPVQRIGAQVEEPLLIHCPAMGREERRQRALEMLTEVGLPDAANLCAAFPHHLSGGMRQRVMIAIAMILKPKLLIADEPTTALDVTIQAQIIDLIKRLKDQYRMSLLLISHNMGLVATVCDRIIVMYAGRFAEEARVDDIFCGPLHPYTKGLFKSIPALDAGRKELVPIKGSVPHPSQFLKGCRFQPRCEFAFAQCSLDEPPPLFGGTDAQRAACWLYAPGVKNGDKNA